MLETFMYIALALGLAFVLMMFLFKYLRKKRANFVREFEQRNPEYNQLQDERDRIIRERASQESEHPYQRLLSAKFKLDKAVEAGNERAVARSREIIQSILAEYDTTEEQLARAYQAQIDAMNSRLAEIELRQRQLRLLARKNAFRLKNIFGKDDD